MPHRSRGAFPPLPPSEERQGNAAQPHTARQPRTHRGRRAFSHDSPLAKGAKQAYKKGERRILLLHRFQRRHGRFAPPPHARLPPLTIFFDPDPSSLGRGQLFLIGVRCQQQDKGHSDKQDEKTSPHGGTVFPGGDAALAPRKKRGFSLCSGAGVRSRVRQSGPLAVSMCAVPFFPRGAGGSGIAARRPAATAAARGRLAVKGKPASMRWQGDVMQ